MNSAAPIIAEDPISRAFHELSKAGILVPDGTGNYTFSNSQFQSCVGTESKQQEGEQNTQQQEKAEPENIYKKENELLIKKNTVLQSLLESTTASIFSFTT